MMHFNLRFQTDVILTMIRSEIFIILVLDV